ncbi:hypothetical protein DPMN_096973 [Dreissena polymorpha]|uniref:Uncharacterized protein n=1 Tax=Dreissena polymorpha TaxID=45954 RepID=A0A9D4R452_DREPO|nr:hypothetical protein DPMN_096973 [Dreissena polymorpha]
MPGRRLRYPSRAVSSPEEVFCQTPSDDARKKNVLVTFTWPAVYRCKRFPVFPPYNEVS